MSRPTKFDGINLIMRAPAGAENVQDMPVFQTRHSCVSCWTVSGDELAEINSTGKIFLSVLMGGQQPPVYVGSESTCRAVMVDFGPVWPVAPRPTIPSPSTHVVPDDRQSYPQGMTVNDLDAARKWLAKRWCVEHPNEGHVKQLAEYAASLRTTPPQTKSVALALIDGPETLEPSSEPVVENIGEIGTRKGITTFEGGMTTLFNNSSSPLITEQGGKAFHDGLRTEARAQASPSRRKVGDGAYVECLSEKETPASPETNKIGDDDASETKQRLIERVLRARSALEGMTLSSEQEEAIAGAFDAASEVIEAVLSNMAAPPENHVTGDVSELSARLNRLLTTCHKLKWVDVGVLATDHQDTQAALDELSMILFHDGIATALATTEGQP